MSGAAESITTSADPPNTQPDPAATALQPDRPRPPRYWWLRRILLAGLLFLASLVVVRLWWGAYAERQLGAALEQIRAEGGMLSIEQYKQPPVPDEDNAADLLLQAASLVRTGDVFGLYPGNIGADPTLLVRYPAASETLLAQNRHVLPLVTEARQRSGCDWHVRFARPLVLTSLPALSGLRALAKALCDEAMVAHAARDDLTAIEYVQDVRFISRRTQDMPAFLIGHLVGGAIEALATSQLEWMAVDLRVPPDQAAMRDRVEHLIADLLDVCDWRQSLIRAMDAERLSVLDSFTNAAGLAGPGTSGGVLGGGGAPFSARGWCMRPMILLDLAWALERLRVIADAAHAENYPDARRNLARYPLNETPYARMVYAVGTGLLPAYEDAFELHFRLIAMRRMAAVALALRLYELDHGCRPPDLNALVPEYLPSVPLDPFAADGRTISYLPNADVPRLYSIGRNGRDGHGTYAEDWRSAGGDKADLVFFLTHDHPRATIEPSPQAGNH